MNGDLHIHTTASDGTCSIEQVFALASQAKLGAISITDHDHIGDHEKEKILGRQYQLAVIPGVEVSTYDYERKRKVHILCYSAENWEPIRKICMHTTKNRREAGIQMAEQICKQYPITLEQIKKTAESSDAIYKQHILYTLMQAGYATELFGDLWKELFGKNGSCLSTCIQPDIWEVIPELKLAKAFCVLAHPFEYRSIELMEELSDKGLLDGIEVYSSKQNQQQENELLSFAQKRNLLVTGGSDFHGAFASRISPIGSSKTPESSIRALQKES